MVLCGYEGYAEFLSKDWIEHVLQKQNEELGCFSEKDIKRAKRDTNTLKNGCVDHLSGVGMALYGLVIRYLTEYDVTSKENEA